MLGGRFDSLLSRVFWVVVEFGDISVFLGILGCSGHITIPGRTALCGNQLPLFYSSDSPQQPMIVRCSEGYIYIFDAVTKKEISSGQ